jgi:hypothetical protein
MKRKVLKMDEQWWSDFEKHLSIMSMEELEEFKNMLDECLAKPAKIKARKPMNKKRA